MDPQAILLVITYLITEGIPATINVLNAWKKEDPTLEDFQKLKDKMKRPEDF